MRRAQGNSNATIAEWVFLDTSTVHFIGSRPSVGLLGMLLVLLAVFGCSGDPSKNYTITVDYVFIQPEEDEIEGSKDYSSATVTLNRVDLSESNEKVVSELSTSSLRNEEVSLSWTDRKSDVGRGRG